MCVCALALSSPGMSCMSCMSCPRMFPSNHGACLAFDICVNEASSPKQCWPVVLTIYEFRGPPNLRYKRTPPLKTSGRSMNQVRQVLILMFVFCFSHASFCTPLVCLLACVPGSGFEHQGFEYQDSGNGPLGWHRCAMLSWY